MKPAQVGSSKPFRGLVKQPFKDSGPLLFDSQRHGKGQQLFEHFGARDHSSETIGLHLVQKIPKTQDLLQGSGTPNGAGRHEPAKSGDHPCTGQSGNHKAGRSDAEELLLRQKEEETRRTQGRDQVTLLDPIRPPGLKAAVDQC